MLKAKAGTSTVVDVYDSTRHWIASFTKGSSAVVLAGPTRTFSERTAPAIKEEEMEKLLRYIQKPSPTTCFVLCAQTLSLWKKHRAEIERVGKLMECTRLKGRNLVSWLKNRMAEKGKKLSEDAAEYLVEVAGDHLHDLDNAFFVRGIPLEASTTRVNWKR
jgi:DNA polymerase-3 subunit delta